jgi:hypothetical protein
MPESGQIRRSRDARVLLRSLETVDLSDVRLPFLGRGRRVERLVCLLHGVKDTKKVLIGADRTSDSREKLAGATSKMKEAALGMPHVR